APALRTSGCTVEWSPDQSDESERDVNIFGTGKNGSSASEMPPLGPVPTPPAAAVTTPQTTEPIPIQRSEPGTEPHPTVAGSTTGDVAAGAGTTTADPAIGPTGRPWPDLAEPRPISIHGNARI